MQPLGLRMAAWALVALACAALLGCGGGRRGGGLDLDAGPRGDGGSRGDGAVPSDGGGGVDSSLPVDGGGRDDGGPPGDSGPRRDSGTDSGTDAGTPDAGWDAGWDAGTDAGPPADTISDIQRALIPAGTTVTIEGVVVTARFSVGMWVQDPSGGAAYSGIRVYAPSAPTVSVGDLVDVEGEVIEYYGETEIELATVTRRGATTPISPTPLTIAQARTEAYEGVLVTLTDISSTVSSYDCSLDDPGCGDSGLWEARSGSQGIVVYDFVYESTDWLSHVGETPVTGVMGWRYDRRRIMPRIAADFGI